MKPFTGDEASTELGSSDRQRAGVGPKLSSEFRKVENDSSGSPRLKICNFPVVKEVVTLSSRICCATPPPPGVDIAVLEA